MPVISISITSDLRRRLDAFMKEKGYSSRSEAIRDAVRASLAEYDLSRLEKGWVTATITTICDYNRHEVDERLTRLRHDYDELVTNNMHIHLGKEYCLEIFVAQGEVEDVLSFIGRIRAMRGIQQVKYTLVPLMKNRI